ncbi:MAG: hypothetical protein LBM98_07200 [Oscillospiraceae bacterium]|nr:hypothetical protein [Oscillospiraceae bacterium]
MLRAARNDGAPGRGRSPFRRTPRTARGRAGLKPAPTSCPPKPPSLESARAARKRGGCLPQDATLVQTLVSDI